MNERSTTGSGRRFGDIDTAEFRAAAHRVADMVADYLERLEAYPVLPRLEPGYVRSRLPAEPPSEPEPLEPIFDDYLELIEPNVTHWQHPGFLAYFSSVASGPGILGEMLAAGLNSNVMFWQNAPASTELEQTVVAWLRQMLRLPPEFDGMFTDTASVSSLTSLVAARHAALGHEARELGLAAAGGRRLRLYCSTEAHSSIEKASIVTGLGRTGARRIEADGEYRMKPDALASAVAEDRREGWLPFCVVATLGSTSSTSVDPADAIADICEREKLWLHVDAAYAGVAAMLEEKAALFSGWERADSIVVNPHKWLFTPFDASLLLFRNPELYREAFSIVPDYLRTAGDGVRNYHEYGIQLGRRFRALKLWMLIRRFGAEGIADRLRHHCELAQTFAARVDAHPEWERLAPVPFSTVCLRWTGHRRNPPDDAVNRALDEVNAAILAHVNQRGKIYLSHTSLRGRYTLRVSVGNPRTGQRHLDTCWEELQAAARAIGRAGQ